MSDTHSATALLNFTWSRLLMEELRRLGIAHCVLSPGSRCTPLTVSAAMTKGIRCHVHMDERGAAFYALGLARATRAPVALVCTSGSATANYLPAVIEADMDAVPLLLLTADRPPELRGSGANQTIDQVHLYGKHVRGFVDLPCPAMETPGAMLCTALGRAVRQAMGPVAGPVQLNCMFREPFLPNPLPEAGHLQLKLLATGLPAGWLPPGWLENGKPWAPQLPAQNSAYGPLMDDLAMRLRGAQRPLLVVGRLTDDQEAAAVRKLARTLLCPVVADALSGLRGRVNCPGLLRHPDLLLQVDEARAALRPDLVLHIGGRLTSKRVLEFLRDCTPRPYLQVQSDARPDNPYHLSMTQIEAPIADVCLALASRLPEGAGDVRLATLLVADQRIADGLAAELDGEDAPMSEPAVCRAIAAILPDDDCLALAASLPVREVDAFAGRLMPDAQRLLANRGASGIDGTLATAVGFAVAHERATTLIVGDLALLHDLNSLLLARDCQMPIVIVVFNNDGGGIFHFLPVAKHAPALFERFFATPHGLNFDHAAAMFGAHHERPTTLAAFRLAYRNALHREGVTILEIDTDRADTPALYARLQKLATRWVDGKASS